MVQSRRDQCKALRKSRPEGGQVRIGVQLVEPVVNETPADLVPLVEVEVGTSDCRILVHILRADDRQDADWNRNSIHQHRRQSEVPLHRMASREKHLRRETGGARRRALVL